MVFKNKPTFYKILKKEVRMVSSLRNTVFKNFGKIDYLHYFRRMIKDYESRKWDFDIRTIVKNVKVEIPCPKYICKRGFSKRLCLTILDDNLFLKEFDRYLNGYIRPMQELNNQDCSLVNYDCKKCPSRYECDLSRKLSKKDDHIYKLTRLAEILYGNLNKGYWANLVEN